MIFKQDSVVNKQLILQREAEYSLEPESVRMARRYRSFDENTSNSKRSHLQRNRSSYE
jgi:hypothetical protein